LINIFCVTILKNVKKMDILLTGGTGFIGTELRPILLQHGHSLTIVTRSPGHHKSEQTNNQQFVSWDEDFIAFMEKADAVMNLAGESIFDQRWTDEVKKRIYSSRIDNTKKLVDAIKKADQPPEVMISASAEGYYGSRGTKRLTEDQPPGDDFLASVCVDWENAAKPVREAGVRLAIPRFGIVLEKGGGALKQMLPPFKLFVGGPIGRGTQFVPWIHRRDLCRGLLFPLTDENFEGIYNFNAPNPVRMEEFARAVGDALNRPSIFRVPEFMLHLVLGEAATPILASLRTQPARLHQAGFDFQFNYVKEALNNILK
jgi:uncharacterized protein (TIGR01777 family)